MLRNTFISIMKEGRQTPQHISPPGLWTGTRSCIQSEALFWDSITTSPKPSDHCVTPTLLHSSTDVVTTGEWSRHPLSYLLSAFSFIRKSAINKTKRESDGGFGKKFEIKCFHWDFLILFVLIPRRAGVVFVDKAKVWVPEIRLSGSCSLHVPLIRTLSVSSMHEVSAWSFKYNVVFLYFVFTFIK